MLPLVKILMFFTPFFAFILIKKKNVLTFILRERKTDIQRIPSRLHAVSAEPDMGLKLTNCEIMT